MIITSVNIANSFLQKSFEEDIPLTVLKLNKLIYLFFRNYLKETGNILFSEPFEAWNTGPVLPNVQSKFQSFRKEPVKKFAYDATGKISALKLEAGTEVHRIFNKVWYAYNSFTSAELVKETTGKAWLKAITEEPHLLKNEYIIEE